MYHLILNTATNNTSYLEKQWNTFTENFALFTVLVAIFTYLIKKYFDFLLNKGLSKVQANFNESIQTKLELIKLDHQKVLLNFEKFNSQQNEKYPQLYYLVEHALGFIMSIRGLKKVATFENANEEDVRRYCEEIEMNNGDIDRIILKWNSNKEDAVTEIKRIKERIDYNIAETKWYDASDYLIYNELFFSDEVSYQTRNLLNYMYKYWLNLDPDYYTPIFSLDLIELRKDNDEYRSKIHEEKKIWKEIMKKAVSPS